MQAFSRLVAGILTAGFVASGHAASPDDPRAPVPESRYTPALSGTKSYRPVAPLPWSDVNRRVAPKQRPQEKKAAPTEPLIQAAASAELGMDAGKIGDERQAAAVSARVRALLLKPLTAPRAVQVALLNNRGLQAAYNELGISETQMAEASLPPPPTVVLARLVGSGGYEIERAIVQNVLALITPPRYRRGAVPAGAAARG